MKGRILRREEPSTSHEEDPDLRPEYLLRKAHRNEPMTVAQTAAFVGVNRARVSQLEHSALRKLRAALADFDPKQEIH
jgi:DNA-directed RNA polymerase sigma subunit (sigma70/sigma32)